MSDGVMSAAPAAGPPPARRVGRWLLFLAGAACLWALLFKGCTHFTVIEPRPEWTAQHAGPPPEDFRYLAFPRPEGADIYDAPAGRVLGPLARAVAMSVGEEKGEWVRVAGAGYAERAALTLAPPANAEWLIDGYELAMKAQTGSDFIWAGLTHSVSSGGLPEVTFRQSFDDHAFISAYRVSGRTAVPLSFTRDGLAGAFEAAVRSLVSIPITLVVGAVLTALLRRRLLPSRRVS